MNRMILTALALLFLSIPANADDEQCYQNVLERDANAVAHAGALGVIGSYGLFAPGSGAHIEFCNEASEYSTRYWNATLDVHYEGPPVSADFPAKWWLDTTDNFQSCIFQIGCADYAAMNGLEFDEFACLISEKIQENPGEPVGRTPPWDTEADKFFRFQFHLNKSVVLIVTSKTDLRSERLTTESSLQFTRLEPEPESRD